MTVKSLKFPSGTLVGIVASLLLVSYHLLTTPTKFRQQMLFSAGGQLIIWAVIFGGAISGLIIQKYIMPRKTKAGASRGCIVGSLLISPLSLYYGIIFGTIGGGLGSTFGGEVGFHIGIFFAIMVVIIIIEYIGAVIGALIDARMRNGNKTH